MSGGARRRDRERLASLADTSVGLLKRMELLATPGRQSIVLCECGKEMTLSAAPQLLSDMKQFIPLAIAGSVADGSCGRLP